MTRESSTPSQQLKNLEMLCSHSLSLQLALLTTTILCFLDHSAPVLSTDNQHHQHAATSMDPVELETLFKIMESLSSDQDWRHSYPNPCEPGSSWPGIQCKLSGRDDDNRFHVSRLDFGTPPNPPCKDSATFPPEIFQLPRLESVFIFRCFNRAPATIPTTATFVSSPLQQLSLRSNPALTTAIPPQLSSLKSLQVLTLSQNSLTGPIPVEIFRSMSSLLHLDLSYNMLSGPIPSTIGNLRSLVGLDLSYNKLTGPIPRSIGEVGTLQKLDLSSNSLTGAIPDSIGNLRSLVFLALSNNRLRAGFPRGISGLRNLEYFLMNDNPMFVTLPPELSKLKKLQELRLSNSGYWGRIPAAYSELANLSSLSLQNNRLSGPIPEAFANLSHIYHLNLSRNFLDGAVPFNSGFLKRLGRNLDLSGNAGLCLRQPAVAENGNGGVGVCLGDSETSNKSESTLHCCNVFVVNVALIFFLTLVNCG